jgi:hypothetical protein
MGVGSWKLVKGRWKKADCGNENQSKIVKREINF